VSTTRFIYLLNIIIDCCPLLQWSSHFGKHIVYHRAKSLNFALPRGNLRQATDLGKQQLVLFIFPREIVLSGLEKDFRRSPSMYFVDVNILAGYQVISSTFLFIVFKYPQEKKDRLT